MARPLTGSIRALRSGRFQASVPAGPGSTRRISATFDTRRQADAWVTERVAELKTGRTPAHPQRHVPATTSRDRELARHGEPGGARAGATDLAVLFALVHRERYLLLGNDSATRGEAVRSDFELHLRPFFAACEISDVRDITREHVVGLSRWLAGYPATVTPYQADSCGRTVHLEAPATALKRSTAGNVLTVLRMILDGALARGFVPVNVAQGVNAREPDPARRRPTRPKLKDLPLESVRELARHLDVINQTVLWLYRLLGVRASEAFGPCVGDFVDRGAGQHGLLTFQAQGGRDFKTYDAEGGVRVEPSSDRLKTKCSPRQLPLPIALSDLLRFVVAAFHTDPVTGEIDLKARLIPGVRNADSSGQSRFREQLAAALQQVGSEVFPPGCSLELKAFRSQVASELDERGFDQHVRHRYLGHELGPTVQELHYIDVSPERLDLVAQSYDQLIDDHLGGTLIVPTHRRPQLGRSNPLAARVDHIEDVLSEAGWLQADPAIGNLLLVPDIATELGQAVTTVRRKLASGQLPGRKVPDPSGGEQWAATRADVEAHRDQRSSPPELNRIAEDCGLDYQTALRTLRRLFPDLPGASGGRLQLTTEHEAALRTEVDRLDRLNSRSLRLGAAVELLDIGERSLRRLLAGGSLEPDPETDGNGTTYVTRASVARLQAERDGRRTDPTDPDSLTVADLAIFADLTPAQVSHLVRAGHLESSADSARPGVTRASVHRWASGYRPDLLDVLGHQGPPKPARP